VNSNDMELARATAAQEISGAILRAAGEAMQKHGNDPLGIPIVATGFVLAIRSITQNLDPKFRTLILEGLR
jgi:hypothetical protein